MVAVNNQSDPIKERTDMEYVISDKNSTGLNAYWFERSIPTLELARLHAQRYPEAGYIIEYKNDLGLGGRARGVVPTGRSWIIEKTDQLEAQLTALKGEQS